MVGERSGMLLVTTRAGSDGFGRALWNCVCDCGGSRTATSAHLKQGLVSSCGCKKNDKSKTLTYRSWQSMRDRCLGSGLCSKNYRQRGIVICERWSLYRHFLSDMGERPSPQHSIDRIDPNGNYEPSNCRWATKQEQGQNTRFTKLTTDLVNEIRGRVEHGESLSSVARRIGTVSSNISQIVSRRTWRNVP